MKKILLLCATILLLRLTHVEAVAVLRPGINATGEMRIGYLNMPINSSRPPFLLTQPTARSAVQDGQIPDRQVQGKSTDISAPDIIMLSPREQAITVDSAIFTVKAVILSYSIPLTEVSLSLNGNVISTQRLNEPVHTTLPFEIQVTLQPGENTLSIVAANEKTSSSPQIRKIIYTPVNDPGKPDLIVLAIGISKYKDVSSNFASRDAEAFARAMNMQVGKGGLFGNVKFQTLLNEGATREGIIKGLRWLNIEANSDKDVRVLFLAGLIENFDEPYFLSSQHEAKADPELTDVKYSLFWDTLSAREGQAIIFADTSYSRFEKGFIKISDLIEKYNYSGITTYVASAEGKATLEHAAWGHGAFTKAILDGLSGKADLSRDGFINTEELGQWLKRRVGELTVQAQRPWFFARKNRPLPIFKVTASANR